MTSRDSCIRLAGVRRRAPPGAVAGDRLDVGDRQVGAGQDDRGRRGGRRRIAGRGVAGWKR